MKNIDVVNIYNGLDKISQKSYKGIEFNLSILRNKKTFKEYIDTLNETLKPSEQFTEYEQKRVALLKEVSTDADGNISTKEIGNGNIEYIINPDKKEEFLIKINELKVEYSDSIKEQDEKMKSYDSFMNTPVSNFNYVRISKSILPEDLVIDDMNLIFDIIDF